jgi:membrane-associated phospholipid phosphatase
MEGSGAMLEPTGPNLLRLGIRKSHWGQWLVTGAVGLVGFVVLALLLSLSAGVDQFDQPALAAVISVRGPHLTLLAQAASWLGSPGARVALAIAGAVLLWFRSRRVLLPIALLAALAATASLVTILKIALDRPRPPATLVVGTPLTDDAFPSGHAAGGSVVLILIALLLGLTAAKPHTRRFLLITGCLLALLIGWSRSYLGDHWPTDVVAGWLLAAVMVSATMGLVNLTLVPYPGGEMPDVIDSDPTPTTLQPAGNQASSQPIS